MKYTTANGFNFRFKGIVDYTTEEFKKQFPELILSDNITDTITITKNLTDTPRFIKCHLPWDLLPRDLRENRKNPKVCILRCYSVKMMKTLHCYFDGFISLIIELVTCINNL